MLGSPKPRAGSSPQRNAPHFGYVVVLAAAAAACLSCADAQKEQLREGVRPTYDKATGRLTELHYDSNRNGRFDTWTDMDGAKPLRSRIDRNEDGKIDRWEHYDDAGQLAKVGFSRSDDGRADAWAYPGAGNTVQKVEISSTGDEQRIDRWEYYDAGTSLEEKAAVVRAEEDTNADGRPDKWETYQDGALETVAFDQNGDGVPDHRLTYRDADVVLVESEPDGSGRFTRQTQIK